MTCVDLAVRGGRVYHAGEWHEIDLGITDGQVTHITNGPLEAEQSLELDGELVVPGMVDGHVHFREPGYEDKEGIERGSAAAAAGGVTTVIEMPNTVPPVTTVNRLKEKVELFRQQSHVDFGLYGALTEGNIRTGDVQELAQAGITAFKTFMATSFGPLLIDNLGELYTAFEAVAKTGLPVYIHAEDQEYLQEFERRVLKRGIKGIDQFVQSRPPIAERTAVGDVIEIVRETRTRTVIVHVTTSQAVEQIKAATRRGLPIDAEVTPYHLSVDRSLLTEIGTRGIGTPPVRSTENREQLLKQFDAGTITLLGSDHAPHTIAEKDRPPLEVAPGMPQLETALPVMLELVNRGQTSVKRIVKTYAEAPARLHGLYPRKGTLTVGADADFIVLDLDRSLTVDADSFESTARYSPFEGWELTGMPILTYQRGRKVAEDMDVVSNPGEGVYMTPHEQNGMAL